MEKILYHGSKHGLIGDIAPISRADCDFGKGFYMGEDMYQAASLVANETDAVLYEVGLDIPENARVLRLEGRDWLYAVLSCRGRVKEFSRLDIAAYWRSELAGYDLIAGRIADDQMNEAMDLFSDLLITDEALYACLRNVRYGDQYVAKSEMMCRSIRVISSRPVDHETFKGLDGYMRSRLAEARSTVIKINSGHRDGMFLDQIIQEEIRKETGRYDGQR